MREKQQQKPAVYISDRLSALNPKPSTLKQKPNHQSEPGCSIGKPLFVKLHQTIHQKPRSQEIPSIMRNSHQSREIPRRPVPMIDQLITQENVPEGNKD